MRADGSPISSSIIRCPDVCALLSLLGELLGVAPLPSAAAEDECDRLMAHQPEYMRSNVARRPVPGPGEFRARPDNDGASPLDCPRADCYCHSQMRTIVRLSMHRACMNVDRIASWLPMRRSPQSAPAPDQALCEAGPDEPMS